MDLETVADHVYPGDDAAFPIAPGVGRGRRRARDDEGTALSTLPVRGHPGAEHAVARDPAPLPRPRRKGSPGRPTRPRPELPPPKRWPAEGRNLAICTAHLRPVEVIRGALAPHSELRPTLARRRRHRAGAPSRRRPAERRGPSRQSAVDVPTRAVTSVQPDHEVVLAVPVDSRLDLVVRRHRQRERCTSGQRPLRRHDRCSPDAPVRSPSARGASRRWQRRPPLAPDASRGPWARTSEDPNRPPVGLPATAGFSPSLPALVRIAKALGARSWWPFRELPAELPKGFPGGPPPLGA